MEDTKYQEVWDLDKLFPGGSESHQLLEHIKELKIKINKLHRKVSNFQPPHNVADSIKVAELMEYIGTLRIHLSQANSFIICLLAQNPKERKATSLQSEIGHIGASFESLVHKTQKILQSIEGKFWKELLDSNLLSNYKFILNEWRKQGEYQLNENEEKLVSDLMIDGYHSWGQFYNALISELKVHVSINGTINELSVGQAIKLRSHSDVEVRKESHEALEKTWEEKEDLFSRILNHIAGFRLQVYKNKGIENVLKEPLIDNRIEEDTLDAMWGAVNKHKKTFTDYLDKKAEMLGETKLNAYNFWAPITENKQQIDYKKAVDFVIKHLSEFGPELENFTLNAFEKGWVESENRSNKSAVAFCAGFPLIEESRIFMTYGGSINDVLTLTHELGHAYHNYAMKDVDGLNRHYPMSLAETASTFSEMIVLDAAIEKTTSNEEKIFLLDEKLKRSVMNFMNIYSRFLFEQNFYQERKQGFVTPSRLNTLMKEAINEAYNGSLGNASAYSWVWTPHYYITKSPFYNFPYTFGYLFSLCIYAKAKEKGKEFEREYLALLRDSGRMSTENLVMKYLEEDITSELFWEKGLRLCIKDVKEFIRLTENT
ncbi:M3 family oligoendopeptidase [Oceanobacillus damuensis]|uniref:M3 family oligoendopeptidase n=1 Tax=Oceanobacillus damuensis TaxID=937928 RepID=UPI00082FC7E7|nr:M3 family oligoendopeptidase [Oceanobacillus damuensis]